VKKFFFWQSQISIFKKLNSSKFGQNLIIILNYLIWVFLFFISFLLIKKDINTFWQILPATVLSEFIEKFFKNKIYWKRPIYKQAKAQSPAGGQVKLPKGLVQSWYNTGSFPSGHTVKAVYFFLFSLQYKIFNPFLYLLITIPLIFFRILVGFHYPIDILGGLIIGPIIWLLIHQINFPPFLLNLTQIIFNKLFFI